MTTSQFNRGLLALTVGLLLAVLLIYYTPIVDGVIAVISAFIALIVLLFPGINDFHNKSWFSSPATTTILSIICTIAFLVIFRPLFLDDNQISNGSSTINTNIPTNSTLPPPTQVAIVENTSIPAPIAPTVLTLPTANTNPTPINTSSIGYTPLPTPINKDDETITMTGTVRLELAREDVVIGLADKYQDLLSLSLPKFTIFVIYGPLSEELTIYYGGYNHWSLASPEFILQEMQGKINEVKRVHPRDHISRGYRVVDCSGSVPNCRVIEEFP